MRKALGSSIAVLLAVTPLEAIAETCTASTTAVSFGAYDPFSGSPTDATGNVQVACSGLLNLRVSYNILLGAGGSGSYATRQMASGANRLNYNLYTNSSRSVVWGDGTSGTSIVSDSYLLSLSTTTRNYPVYGRIPASQNAYVGSYGDTVTVTVNY